MDTVTAMRMMGGDHEITIKASDKRNGAASVRTDDQLAGKLALTTQTSRAAIFYCPSLSMRECGILELIGQGYSNKKVARTLGISAETVKSHVKRVFIKLDVNTRAHAVARAQSLGLFGLGFVR
jgi:ATP/maltotriose-dependent transcriptional regulator MalT